MVEGDELVGVSNRTLKLDEDLMSRRNSIYRNDFVQNKNYFPLHLSTFRSHFRCIRIAFSPASPFIGRVLVVHSKQVLLAAIAETVELHENQNFDVLT